MLARAHQDAIWDRQQTVGKLRSILREFYPALLSTFEDLSSREARATLTLAPQPGSGSQGAPVLSGVRVATSWSNPVHRPGCREDPGRAPSSSIFVNPSWWKRRWLLQASAYARALTTLVDNIHILQEQLEVAYQAHPDAHVISSFPGLGTVLGARILGEIGDDRTRFATARGLKAFAGTAPITRASGTKTADHHEGRPQQAARPSRLPLVTSAAGPLTRRPRPLRPATSGR